MSSHGRIARHLLAASLLTAAAWSMPALAADPVPLSLFVSPEGLFGDVNGDTYSYKLIGEATGVKFDITRGVFESEDDKLGTVLASGDLPNVISMRDSKWVDDLGPKGLFVRLDDYINAGKMPNLKAQMEKRGVPWQDITSADGHIYMAPQFSDVEFVKPAMLMRADLLQACGYVADKNNPVLTKPITTPDDLVTAFQCLQKQLGGGPVIAARDGLANFLPGWAAWFGSSLDVYYNPDSKQFEYGPLSNRYRAMLQFFNTLYQQKILNPDYATLTDAEWSAIHDAGKAGAALENIGWNYERLGAKGIDPGKDFFLQSLTIDGQRIKWPWPSPRSSGQVLVISASSSQEQIDAAVKMIDYLYSDEGAQLVWYGKEGTDWKVKADGTACFTGTILFRPWAHGYCDGQVPDKSKPTFVQDSLLDGNPLYRIYGYGWKTKWPGVDNPDVAPNRWNEVLKQFQDGGSMTDPIPAAVLNQDEVSTVAQYGTPLDTYVSEETQKFIEGTRPLNDDEWAKFTQQVKDLGAQQVVDAYNAALSRRK